jgi:hypothetical protein
MFLGGSMARRRALVAGVGAAAFGPEGTDREVFGRNLSRTVKFNVYGITAAYLTISLILRAISTRVSSSKPEKEISEHRTWLAKGPCSHVPSACPALPLL